MWTNSYKVSTKIKSIKIIIFRDHIQDFLHYNSLNIYFLKHLFINFSYSFSFFILHMIAWAVTILSFIIVVAMWIICHSSIDSIGLAKWTFWQWPQNPRFGRQREIWTPPTFFGSIYITSWHSLSMEWKWKKKTQKKKVINHSIPWLFQINPSLF